MSFQIFNIFLYVSVSLRFLSRISFQFSQLYCTQDRSFSHKKSDLISELGWNISICVYTFDVQFYIKCVHKSTAGFTSWSAAVCTVLMKTVKRNNQSLHVQPCSYFLAGLERLSTNSVEHLRYAYSEILLYSPICCNSESEHWLSHWNIQSLTKNPSVLHVDFMFR